jgi:hypothetical protein
LVAATLTDAPVLATSLDHLTGRLYPIALFERGNVMASAINESDFSNPASLYKEDGIVPHLELGQIPTSFHTIFAHNNLIVQSNQRNPSFAESQLVQNPTTVKITPSTIPAAVRYPNLYDTSNTVFGLVLPLTSDNSERHSDISREHLETIIHQAEYPLSHSAHASPGKDFANTNTLLIETRDIEQSRMIAELMDQKSWMQDWRNKPETQVILAEVNSFGKTKQCVGYN